MNINTFFAIMMAILYADLFIAVAVLVAMPFYLIRKGLFPFGLVLVLMAGGAANAQTAAQLSPDQSVLITDFNGLAGSLQATSATFEHMKAELKSVIEAHQKDAAELVYWRQYFAGLPKPAPK